MLLHEISTLCDISQKGLPGDYLEHTESFPGIFITFNSESAKSLVLI